MVAALVPPGPVAVSEIVVLPVSCGVPVIAPVVVFSVAQLGKPVAAQLVTGRSVLSVSENVLVNAVPTVPEAVCDAVMSGRRKPTFISGQSTDPILRINSASRSSDQKLNSVAGLENLEAPSGRITFGSLL